MIVLGSAIAIAAATAVALIRRAVVLVTVDGESMTPTISDGERVLVKRVRLGQVVRGDVVVVRYAEMLLIKRAVAVPGDPMPAEVALTAGVPAGAPVPAGRLAVLGDNAANSLDSRTCGLFGGNTVVGVVLRRR